VAGTIAKAKLATDRITAKAAEAKRAVLSFPNMGLGPLVWVGVDQASRVGLAGMIAKAKKAAEITTEKAAAKRRFEVSLAYM
jgi:hypothetical protein